MQKQLIQAIKAGPEPLDDELFLAIFEIEDTIEQQKFIEAARAKCREQKKLTEFNNMLRAWTSKNAQNQKQQGSNKTRFTDGPLVLNCGQWEATDTGIYKHELSGKGLPYKIFACPHPILPVERLVNIDTNTEKLRLAFFKDDRWQYVTVDCTTCYNKQNITVLGDRGVMVTSETAKNLVCYLSDVVSLNMKDTEEGKAIPLYRSIARLGWIGNGKNLIRQTFAGQLMLIDTCIRRFPLATIQYQRPIGKPGLISTPTRKNCGWPFSRMTAGSM